MATSKLKCVLHAFDFNDGSRVVWYPADQNGKAHGSFSVAIQLKTSYGGKSIVQRHKGPPSAKASLHWLKIAKKDNPLE